MPSSPRSSFSASLRSRLTARGVGFVSFLVIAALAVAPTVAAGSPAALDGWFLSFAVEMSHGRVPYRDFYLWAPPLHVFEHLALLELFGPSVFAGHLVGGRVRGGLGLTVYAWLSRRTQAGVALAASLASLAVFSDDPADVIFYYQQQSVFYAVAAGFLLSRAIDLRGTARAARGLALAAGFLGALALLSKQTVGALACAALLFTCIAAQRLREGPRCGLAPLVGAGMAVPLAAFFFWLARVDAVGPFAQAMRYGSSSKGPVLVSFTRIVGVLGEGREYVAAFCAAGGIAVFLLLRHRAGPALRRRLGSPGAEVIAATVLGVAAVEGALLLGAAAWSDRLPQLVAVELGAWGSLAAVALSLRAATREGLSVDAVQWMHAAILAFAISYGLSLSWGAFELMTCPSFAVAVCAATARGSGGGWVRERSAIAGCALFAACAVFTRARLPFDWIWWREPPIAEDVLPSKLPAFAGIRFSEESRAFFEKITDEIDASSKPGDTLFVYPHMPIFHVLADRPPATYSPIGFFDVSPDAIASADAQRLLAAPPKVMVFLQMPPDSVEHFEKLFRGGKRSGQRDIAAAIATLAPGYRLVDRVLMPGTEAPVIVLARRDLPPR